MQRAAWDEESELRELNCRLHDYVGRVRALEQENRRLAQEVAALRGQERCSGRLQRHEEEVAELRLAVAELSRAKGEAELEREALRRERARLETLGAQLLELRRRRLEPEAGELRRQLEQLAADCAALEALLEGLRAERGRLHEERRRRPAKRPALPPPPPPARLSRRELEETCALVLSWNCEGSLERYEAELRALQELEGRLAKDDADRLRAQNQQSRRQLEELHRRCAQLDALAERLEQERRAQVERHGAELAEYQELIEALEEEKRFLTMSIAEYLKDYHELLQVKASLSLEIETYRALLEGESSQWILMWEEEHGRKVPQGVRNMLHEYSNRYAAYRQEKGKRAFPAIQNVDTRYKTPIANMSSSAVYSSQTKPGRIQTAAPGKTFRKDAVWLESRPSAATRKDATHQRSVTDRRQVRTFTPSSVISRESEVWRRTLPETKKADTVITASFSKESTEVRKDTTIPNTFENVRPKVVGVSATSYGLNSISKETKHERTQERTDAQLNKQIEEVKPMKEEKPFWLQERDEKKRSAREATDSVQAKMEKKLTGVETTVNFQKKVEIKHGTEEEKHTMKESNISDSRKEAKVAEDETPKNGKWEERIRVDTSGKDLPSSITMDKNSFFQQDKHVTTQSREAVEIPILSEVHNQGWLFKNNSTEIKLQDLIDKPKDEATPKFSKNIPERELNQDRVHEEGSPNKIDTLLTESIAENIVSGVLKGLVQKSSDSGLPHDTKFTFSEKKASEGGKAWTEVTVQSTVQQDLNRSDEFDLERFLKKDVEGVGAFSEAALEDIVNASLTGRGGRGKRTVQVEIVEEPLESAADERAEFPTPFEVEEAEDTLPSMAGHLYYRGEEKATASTAADLKRQQPSVIVSHVEEVSEGDDVVDEEKYFVSTPEEHPLAHGKDDGSLYGQIHIEEESTIKYSWQDEFLQGAQKRVNEGMGSPELIYQVMGEEERAFVSKDEPRAEQVAHVESSVIEREIKIPHEFQASIKSLFSEESKDPKHQLKEALETLEDSLPESVKHELSVLTKEGQADSSSLEVDIKKVEQTKKGGLVTIVAEVSLSETLDSDQFNTGYLGEGVVERESPTRVSTTYNFDEHRKQESESYSDGRSKAGIIEVSSTPWTTEAFSSSTKLSSSDGVKYHTSEQVVSEGPVFKSLGLDNKNDRSHVPGSFDINRSVRQIVVGPTEIRKTEQVLHEGSTSETLEFGTGGFEAGGTASISRSVQGFTRGPEEIQTTEEITYRGPVRGTVGGPESPARAQFFTDSRSSKHIMLGSKQITEEIIFERPTSDLSPDDDNGMLSQTRGMAETSRLTRHIRIDPKEARSQQVIYEGPFSGVVEHARAGNAVSVDESVRHIKVGQKETPVTDLTIHEETSPSMTEPSHDPDWLFKEGTLDTDTTIRHFKFAPKESVTTEQIVFKGPISEQDLEFSESGQTFPSEGSIRHVSSGQKEIWSRERVSYQGSVSKSSGSSSAGEDALETEGPSEISRSVRHIRLGPAEAHTEQIVFQGPISDKAPKVGVVELSPTDGPPESHSLGHIKIGPKETSFTFQMDITNVAGGGQGAKIRLSDPKDAHPSEDAAKGNERDAESEQRSEKSAFDQTVQLQRMVDHRSVVSDEKKIALLYLNENEEEEEEDGPWF